MGDKPRGCHIRCQEGTASIWDGGGNKELQEGMVRVFEDSNVWAGYKSRVERN